CYPMRTRSSGVLSSESHPNNLTFGIGRCWILCLSCKHGSIGASTASLLKRASKMQSTRTQIHDLITPQDRADKNIARPPAKRYLLTILAGCMLISSIVTGANASQVSVSPPSTKLTASQTQVFTVKISGPSGQVTWTVNGVPGGNTNVGTISASGLYQAPAA